MSYPRSIQVLIVEDESSPREYYEAEFAAIRRNFDGEIAPLQFASDQEAAIGHLERQFVFHLVILDLRLPANKRSTALPEPSVGVELVERFAARDSYPIPALLVISGYLADVSQGTLDERVRSAFFYGRVLVKGASLRGDIQKAIAASARYTEVGVHVRDGGSAFYPTLSPRDDDLLRRAILGIDEGVGVDIRWWSMDLEDPSYDATSSHGWTKVLTGSFLLARDLGRTRPMFFKLTPSSDVEYVMKDAGLMQWKLPHIKIAAKIVASSRALLVTHQVGEIDLDPVSLEDFLDRQTTQTLLQIPGIVRDLTAQIAGLCEPVSREGSPSSLLWAHHKAATIASIWRQWGIGSDDPLSDVVSLYECLSRNRTTFWYQHRGMLHGDLNPSNIAIEESAGSCRGYIFDASGTRGGVSVKDLAVLEITSLLHRKASSDIALEALCPILYDSDRVLVEDLDTSGTSPGCRNTLELVRELRRQARQHVRLEIYALMLVDAALIQLGGLESTISRNKIGRPRDAAILCAAVARWFRRLAPSDWLT